MSTYARIAGRLMASFGASWTQTLIVVALVGASAASLGSLMITRKMVLVGDALGHVALPGMGLALLLKIDPSFGAFVFLALGILLIWLLGERTALSAETLVGIVFVTSLAIGFLIVPRPDLLESLIGDIAKMSATGAAAASGISVLVLFVVRWIYPRMMLLSISTELASVEGISARKHNLVYLACIALVVSVGIKVTGSLLVGALVIIPPATARMLSANLKGYARWSATLGAITGVLGVAVSKMLQFPAGPAIILVSSVLFVFSMLLKQRSVVH